MAVPGVSFCSLELCPVAVQMAHECTLELPFHSPGDLSDPGIELESLVSPALAGGFIPTE